MAFKWIALFFLVVALVSANPLLELQYSPQTVLDFDVSNLLGNLFNTFGDRAGDYIDLSAVSRAMQLPFEVKNGEDKLPADFLNTVSS